MPLFYSFCVFLSGILLGSLFMVVAQRLIRDRAATAAGRSPDWGFLRISQLHLATAFLTLWVFIRFGFTGEGAVGLVLISLGIIVTITDCAIRIIPNKVLLAFLPVLILLRLAFPLHSLWNHLLGAVLGLGMTLVVALLMRGMGMGDVKLFGLIGWVLGIPQMLVAFVLACIMGGLAGTVFLWAKKERRIPFAPWLTAGTLIAFGYGSEIAEWYVSFIS